MILAAKRPVILRSSISALVALFAGSALGATVTLNGSGTGWSVGTDWTNQFTNTTGLPQPSDDLLINTGSLTAGIKETPGTSVSVQTLSFDSEARQ